MGILGTYHRLVSVVGPSIIITAGRELVSALPFIYFLIYSPLFHPCSLDCGLICITEKVLNCEVQLGKVNKEGL